MATTNLPEIEIDLQGPDGNVYVVLAYVKHALKAHHGDDEGARKYGEIRVWMDEGNGGGEYAQLLAHIHDHYCKIKDESGMYDFDDPLFDPTSD